MLTFRTAGFLLFKERDRSRIWSVRHPLKPRYVLVAQSLMSATSKSYLFLETQAASLLTSLLIGIRQRTYRSTSHTIIPRRACRALSSPQSLEHLTSGRTKFTESDKYQVQTGKFTTSLMALY